MGISLGRELNTSLKDLLRQRKKRLLDDWFQRMLDEYPDETAVLLQRHDRFANPVAYAFREAIEAIFRAVTEETDADLGAVEYAVKIRAVQERDPDKGIAFIHLIKEIVREKLGDSVEEQALAEFDLRINRIASAASEMFAIQRAKIAELHKTYL